MSEASGTSTGPAAYVERLTPAWWVWLTCGLVGASSGLAALRVTGPTGATVTAVVGVVLVEALLALSSATVRVADGHLQAGRARLPLRVAGEVSELDAATMAALRGPQIDARAYLCQRGWIPRGVKVELVDPDDPTPYWLVSSRRPAALVRALRAHQAAAGV